MSPAARKAHDYWVTAVHADGTESAPAGDRTIPILPPVA